MNSTMTSCGFDQYMTRIDMMFSSWDTLAGSGLNLLTDIIVGYADSNNPKGTPIVKAFDQYLIKGFEGGWSNADWLLIGRGWQQIWSALVKYEATENFIEDAEPV